MAYKLLLLSVRRIKMESKAFQSQGHTQEAGFSLIEILVTLALISVLAAIGMFYVGDMMTNYRVRGAARQLFSDMQMTRLKAIREGKVHTVEFVTSTTYCIKRQAGAAWDAGCDVGAEDTLDVISKTVDLSRDYLGVTASAVCREGRSSIRTAPPCAAERMIAWRYPRPNKTSHLTSSRCALIRIQGICGSLTGVLVHERIYE